MMEKACYMLQGDPKEVAKVIRENRIRIQRGVISFTPVEFVSISDEAESGIEVNGDSVNDTEDVSPVAVETPQTHEQIQETFDETPQEVTDDKAMEEDDMKEVDLDTDNKAIDDSDSKNEPATEIKKTSKRTKKPE